MAKATGPLFSLKAKGKFGNVLIYQAMPDKNTVYRYHKPTGPASGAQWTQRRFVEFVLAQWMGMSQATKDAWKVEAEKYHSDLPAYHYFLKRAHDNPYTVCGLCGYWSFNEKTGATALDYSPNENNGTLKPTYPTDCPKRVLSRSNKFDKALLLNGSTNYIDCGNDSSLNITNAITIGAWVKLAGDGTYRTIYTRGLTSTIQNYIWTTMWTNNYPHIRIVKGGTNYTLTASQTITEADEWTHLVFWWDGKTIKIAINGEFDANTTSFTGTMAYDTTLAKIGERDGLNFNGTIDEVRILNRAMTAEEIKFIWEKNRYPTT